MTFDPKSSNLSEASLKTLHAAIKISKNRIGVEEILLFRPDLTIGQGEALLVQACGAGLLEVDAPFYSITQDGLSFLHAGMQPRFTRAHADKVIAKAIAAARKWNSDKSKCAVIKELRLFGSTLHKRDDYGDVDIEIHTQGREMSDEVIDTKIEALPYSATNGFEARHYPKVFLKERDARSARNAVHKSSKEASLAHSGTVDEIGCDHMQIYCFDVLTETETSADMTYRPRTIALENPKQTSVETYGQIIPPQFAPSLKTERHFFTSDLGSIADQCWRGQRTEAGTFRALAKSDLGEAIPYKADRMSAMSWLEGCPSWQITGDDPFQVLADLSKAGEKLDILKVDDLFFTIKNEMISVDFPMCQRAGKPSEYLTVTAYIKGGKIDLDLIPRVTFDRNGSGLVDTLPYSPVKPEYVSIARTAVLPIAAIYKMISPAAAVDIDLTFGWNPSQSVSPKLPRLSAIMNAMKTKKVDVLQSDMEGVCQDINSAMERWSYGILDIRQALEIKVGSAGLATENGETFIDLDFKFSDTLENNERRDLSSTNITSRHDWSALLDRTKPIARDLATSFEFFTLALKRKNSFYDVISKDDHESNGYAGLHKAAANLGINIIQDAQPLSV